MMAWGGNHFTPLLHVYEAEAHYAPWQANLLLGMYVFGLVPGLLIAAALSDQHGRKPVMIGGLAAAAAGSILLAAGAGLFAVLCAGRILAGVGVGVAMSVGTSWMAELSAPPFDRDAPAGAAARRPSLTLTLGFGLGAAVTGLLGQWAPAPTHTPFLVHLALAVLAAVPLAAARESLPASRRARGRWWRDLRVPAAGHRTFTRRIVPAAPWVFAAAGVAYAIMPAIAAPRLGDWTTLYATVLTVVTLGSGALVQPFVSRIDRRTGGRALPLGLALMTAGMGLAVVASRVGEPAFALAVAAVLGVAYGITVVAGLAIVQAIATPSDLAGLTGVYYALTYTGFLLPTVLAALLPVASYTVSLSVVAIVCAGCLAWSIAAREPGARR
ncbi:MFS transporter [Microbacterium sp. CBS5P-1]|nr:MFS transporter [Microbacterium excoecariae]